MYSEVESLLFVLLVCAVQSFNILFRVTLLPLANQVNFFRAWQKKIPPENQKSENQKIALITYTSTTRSI